MWKKLLFTTSALASLLSFSQLQAKASSDTDFAPSAIWNVTTVDPADPIFSSIESKFQSPLTGTSTWHRFLRQGGRILTANLGGTKIIHQISVQMKQANGMGVLYPSYVNFEALEGNQWYELGQVLTKTPQSATGSSTQTFSLTTNAAAQEIRIVFPVNDWVFLRNIHIYGILPNGINPTLSAPAPVFPNANHFLTTTSTNSYGIHNMLLVYTGNTPANNWSSSGFLPNLAHMTTGGKLDGRMFDSFLFLPYGNIPETQTGWNGYLTQLFSPTGQLATLNQTMQTVDQTLGKNNPFPKEKVVIGIPYPNGSGSWGTLQNQPISFATPGGKRQAVISFMQNALQDWNLSHFSNLQLVGWYWDEESIQYKKPGDLFLIQQANQMAQLTHLPLFWIPFYGASGVDQWKVLGFQAAWLQTNFVWQGLNALVGRVDSAISLSEQDGLGMEIEIPTQALYSTNYQGLFQQSLLQFKLHNAISNVSHVFYAGSNVLAQAEASSNSNVRGIYDDVYQFIQQTQN